MPVAATRLQGCIEGVPALVTGKRRHEVPPGVADHPFHIAFVVALAGTAITVLEEVMRLKPAERHRSFPRAVRQDARHQALVVVVEDRLGNPAEESEGPVMTVQPSFRRRGRVGAHEASVAVRKRHDEEMRPMLHPGDERIRLAKVRPGMAGRMRQRHEHLPLATAPFANVILDDGLSAREAMLVAKTLEYPLRRVALFAVNCPILNQNTIDDIREGVQLRAFRRLAAPIAWRNRMRQYLGYCLTVDPEPPGRLSLAQSLSMTPQPHTAI